MGKMQHNVNFLADKSGFEFRIFLLLDGCPIKAKEPSQPYSRKQMDSFPEDITTKWNTNSYV